MTKAFVREERYIVIKLKDLIAASGDVDPSSGRSEAEVMLRNHLESWQIPTRECVVVESDWPEYEAVWQMIERRVAANSQPRTEPASSFPGLMHDARESKKGGLM
ncbi:hypothetical protein [Pseudomonas aeruginosa]|uniref:hypothetical protein n=1 Tax=Pseudomonas aeruginosa TaxID=287 RepID=UPI00104A1347|nr:hypothetical protein [Pseudomonas aeruginosa]HCE6897258.1 hypothetical protein [Pseudomonas aeruginosa]HCE6902998.1 hypothetical protein [Pseudomonas aeruginosa]HCE7019919.1 hypothetical protein [Pseudomonas aeruginosa]HCE7064502.1 hypothetical protein [Pseudomonas aeruginosa]HCE7347604.1 hypothetical protein [Pseudomonas aeruginosa]